MKNNHGNNISVGDAGRSNVFNLTQNQYGGQSIEERQIEYQIDERSRTVLSKNFVGKRQRAFWLSAIAPFLAFMADGLALLDYLGIGVNLVFWVLVFIFAPFAVLNYKYQKLGALDFKNGEAKYLPGQYARRASNGDYVVYKRTARCVYPGCKGTVHIKPAPEREKNNRKEIGECDIGEKDHTYSMYDNSLTGYPKQFDWRSAKER